MKENTRKGFVGEAAHGKNKSWAVWFFGAEGLVDQKTKGFGKGRKMKKMWAAWSSFSDSPQCEVHLAMFASCSVGDLAKMQKTWESGLEELLK
jgi:hypothetical protein